MEQMTCSNTGCDGVLLADDRFCGDCGRPVPDMSHPEPWPQTVGTETDDDRTVARNEESFFSHEPRRRSGPLSNVTRYLCAAAYLDRGFANRVIWHLLATRKAVAPSVGFDVGPVLRHCLRARRNILARDVVLLVIVLAGLFIKLLPTVDFLVYVLVLGALLPYLGRRSRGLIGKLALALGAMGGIALAVLVVLTLVVGTIAASIGVGGTGGMGSIGSVATFAFLLAATSATEFVYLRTTFRTLTNELELGAQPPGPVSSTVEERIAMVEGAQWGNVTLHSDWFPFIGAGLQTERHWSIAIKLHPADPNRQILGVRSLDDEHVQIDPVDLHRYIRERLHGLNDQALPENERIAALTVSDRLIGSGWLHQGSPLFDPALKTPYSHASPEAVEALIRHPQSRLRYFQQVSVNDEGPAVMSRGRTVIESVDQEVTISAFVYAAVEGRMFYLQFVLTALPPVASAYRIIGAWYRASTIKTLMYSIKRLFGSIASAPLGIFAAFRLWYTERRIEHIYLSSVGGDFGADISVREIGTADMFGSYIQELDVEKYNQILSRLLLETTQDYLASKGVDISAFESSANNVINGDFNYLGVNNGEIHQFGGRNNRHRSQEKSTPRP
jgi:hypothetical protein